MLQCDVHLWWRGEDTLTLARNRRLARGHLGPRKLDAEPLLGKRRGLCRERETLQKLERALGVLRSIKLGKGDPAATLHPSTLCAAVCAKSHETTDPVVHNSKHVYRAGGDGV